MSTLISWGEGNPSIPVRDVLNAIVDEPLGDDFPPASIEEFERQVFASFMTYARANWTYGGGGGVDEGNCQDIAGAFRTVWRWVKHRCDTMVGNDAFRAQIKQVTMENYSPGIGVFSTNPDDTSWLNSGNIANNAGVLQSKSLFSNHMIVKSSSGLYFDTTYNLEYQPVALLGFGPNLYKNVCRRVTMGKNGPTVYIRSSGGNNDPFVDRWYKLTITNVLSDTWKVRFSDDELDRIKWVLEKKFMKLATPHRVHVSRWAQGPSVKGSKIAACHSTKPGDIAGP